MEAKVSFSVRMSNNDYETLRQYSFQQNRTLQDLVASAVRAYITDTIAPTGGKKQTGEERHQLAVVLDLLHHGPADLVKLQTHLIEFWRQERAKMKT